MAEPLLVLKKSETNTIATEKKVLELGEEKARKLLDSNKRIAQIDIVGTFKPNDIYDTKDKDGNAVKATCKGYGVKTIVSYKSGKKFSKNLPVKA